MNDVWFYFYNKHDPSQVKVEFKKLPKGKDEGHIALDLMKEFGDDWYYLSFISQPSKDQ